MLAAGCSPSSGGSDRARFDVFPIGFFPFVLPVAGDSASLEFDAAGDLLAVAASDSLFRVSRDDGSLEETVLGGDCAGADLVSVLAHQKTIWLGADDGRVFAFDEASGCVEIADLGSEPVTGLARVPRRFELPRGSLVAAAGSDGVFSLDITADEPFPALRLTPDTGETYVDVDFFETILFALDATDGELVTISPDEAGGDAEVEAFVDDLDGAVGIAVEERGAALVIADAGMGALRSIDLLVENAPLVDIAPYPFAAAPPGGIAADGTGTLAIASAGSVLLQVARLPAIPAALGTFLGEANVGYGDLELDAQGDFLLVATTEAEIPDDDGDFPEPENFVLRLPRGESRASVLASGVGSEGERLLSLARDPASGDLFLGSDLGHVFRRSGKKESVTLADLGSAVLGLEWAPPSSEFAGGLVATTEAGDVVEIDPVSGAQTPVGVLPLPLPDLVFASDGTLYVVAQDPDAVGPSAIWERPDGGAFGILVQSAALGLPDGIAIDEGGARLLVASNVGPESDQLLEVTLGAGAVRALVDIDIDDGFFPSGVVYDGLGRVGVRSSDVGAAVDGFELPFPL